MTRKAFGIFGLGDFGKSVAVTLAKNGAEVMAVDIREDKVQEVADHVTMAVRADVTDQDAMKALGIHNLDAVVISSGANLETSIMATIIAKESGVPYVMAKARSELHATVLRKLGVDEIIFPEKAMGERVAKSFLSGNFIDIIELSSKFSMFEILAPQGWAGKTLRELDLRKKGLNVIARKNGDEVEMQLDPDRTLSAEDKFILVGDNNALERLYA